MNSSLRINILSFLSGFIIMTYEVYAFKIVFFFLPENSVTVSITLSAFLLGLGFSTLISKRLLRKKKLGYKKLLQLHFLLFSLLCIICFGALNLPASVINLLGNYPIEESQLLLGKGILIWLILFLPALLVGGFFPSLLSKEVDENDGSKNLNKVYFIDIIGGAIGSLFAGIYWIPVFGLGQTLYLIIILSVLCLLVLNAKNWLNYTPLLGFIFLFFQTQETKNKSELIPYYSEFGEVIFQEPSAYGVVTIGKKLDPNYSKIAKRLFINHRCMCSGTYNVSENELAENTLKSIKPEAKVVNIGLGCGYTANAIASSEKVDSLTIMEINPTVIKAFKEEFSHINDQILNNQKVTVTNKDGLEYILLNKKEKFDAIIVDIEEPGVIQSSLIYTDEYIKLASKQLNNGGVMAIWAIFGGDEYNKILYRTLKNTFPYVIFHSHHGNPQLYGSFEPFEKLVSQADSSWNDLDESYLNTINNRVLEKSYSIRGTFMLPDNYVDDRITQ